MSEKVQWGLRELKYRVGQANKLLELFHRLQFCPTLAILHDLRCQLQSSYLFQRKIHSECFDGWLVLSHSLGHWCELLQKQAFPNYAIPDNPHEKRIDKF